MLDNILKCNRETPWLNHKISPVSLTEATFILVFSIQESMEQNVEKMGAIGDCG